MRNNPPYDEIQRVAVAKIVQGNPRPYPFPVPNTLWIIRDDRRCYLDDHHTLVDVCQDSFISTTLLTLTVMIIIVTAD